MQNNKDAYTIVVCGLLAFGPTGELAGFTALPSVPAGQPLAGVDPPTMARMAALILLNAGYQASVEAGSSVEQVIEAIQAWDIERRAADAKIVIPLHRPVKS